MLDVEKVINQIEIDIQRAERTGEMLVYVGLKTAKDAIAMLKDQKPKPQRYKEHDPFHLPFCPNEDCNAVMDAYWHFCPYCGAPMVWDAELDERERAVKWNA